MYKIPFFLYNVSNLMFIFNIHIGFQMPIKWKQWFDWALDPNELWFHHIL